MLQLEQSSTGYVLEWSELSKHWSSLMHIIGVLLQLPNVPSTGKCHCYLPAYIHHWNRPCGRVICAIRWRVMYYKLYVIGHVISCVFYYQISCILLLRYFIMWGYNVHVTVDWTCISSWNPHMTPLLSASARRPQPIRSPQRPSPIAAILGKCEELLVPFGTYQLSCDIMQSIDFTRLWKPRSRVLTDVYSLIFFHTTFLLFVLLNIHVIQRRAWGIIVTIRAMVWRKISSTSSV